MCHNRFRSGLVFAAILFLTACQSPTEPRGPNIAMTLRVEGPSSVAPGQTASFRAFLVSPSGTREDVTSSAQWQVGDTRFATIAGPGTVTGGERGETGISTSHLGVSATHHILVLETGTFKITGRIVYGTRPVAQAAVTVSRGTGVGLATTSDVLGHYALYGVAGEVELTVSHGDYRESKRSVTVVSNSTGTDIAVTPLVEPYQMAGSWSLTITPSSACTVLPADVGTLLYTASITQNGAEFRMSVPTDACPGGCTAILTGEIVNRTVTIPFPDDPTEGAWVQKLLQSVGVVGASGVAEGNAANDVISGTLNGDIVLYRWPTPPARCSRQDHAFVLSRR